MNESLNPRDFESLTNDDSLNLLSLEFSIQGIVSNMLSTDILLAPAYFAASSR